MLRLCVSSVAVLLALSVLAEEKSSSVSVRSDGNGSKGTIIINGQKQEINSNSSKLSVRVENGNVVVKEGEAAEADAKTFKDRFELGRATAGISSTVTSKDGKTHVEVKDGERVLKFEYAGDENVKVSSKQVNGKTTVTIKGKTVDVSFDFDEEWNKQNKKK